jgi:hypothetical protein
VTWPRGACLCSSRSRCPRAALVAVSGETESIELVAVVRTDPVDDPGSFTFGTVGNHGSDADSRAVLRSVGEATSTSSCRWGT